MYINENNNELTDYFIKLNKLSDTIIHVPFAPSRVDSPHRLLRLAFFQRRAPPARRSFRLFSEDIISRGVLKNCSPEIALRRSSFSDFEKWITRNLLPRPIQSFSIHFALSLRTLLAISVELSNDKQDVIADAMNGSAEECPGSAFPLVVTFRSAAPLAGAAKSISLFCVRNQLMWKPLASCIFHFE